MLTAPTIHLNGTSKERLMEAYEVARVALYKAEEALRETAPNGRDYYVVPGSYEKADKEHMSRLRMVATVSEQIGELMRAIADQ